MFACEDAELLRACHSGIEEGAREHHVVAARPRCDHRRELRALGAVHGQRPGEGIGLERVGRYDDFTLTVVE